MQFTVPQFIEEETKIVGPLSIRQVIFIGVAFGFCVIFYFTIENSFIFFILCAIFLGSGSSLALLKINKTPLPVYIKNLFFFTLKPKMYLWQRREEKEEPEPRKKKTPIETNTKKEKPSVDLIKKRSRLQELSDQIWQRREEERGKNQTKESEEDTSVKANTEEESSISIVKKKSRLQELSDQVKTKKID